MALHQFHLIIYNQKSSIVAPKSTIIMIRDDTMLDTRKSAKNICRSESPRGPRYLSSSRRGTVCEPRAPRGHGEDPSVLMNVLSLTKYKENGDLLFRNVRQGVFSRTGSIRSLRSKVSGQLRSSNWNSYHDEKCLECGIF